MLISGHPCPNDCSPLRFWHSPCFCLWPEACLQGGLAALVLPPSGVALAPRPITRPHMFREPRNFLKCGGRLLSLRFWQHLSGVLCHVAQTGTALLTHISHMGAIWTALLTAMSVLLCVVFTPGLKQSRAGRLR